MTQSINTVKGPGFGSYLIAAVLPPLSFFLQGKIVSGIISIVLLVIAIPFFFIFGFGIIIWFITSLWAMYGLGNKVLDARVQNQANRTAEAIVKAQREAQKEIPE